MVKSTSMRCRDPNSPSQPKKIDAITYLNKTSIPSSAPQREYRNVNREFTLDSGLAANSVKYRVFRRPLTACLLLIAASCPAADYGLTVHLRPPPYLRMPHDSGGSIPALLSQTGAFADTPNLITRDGLVPYDLIVPFWSDGAQKVRAVSVPAGKVDFKPSGEWTFPSGTVLVKTFELATDASNPTVKRRLETRLLVRDASGGVYGVSYKWRADGSDADLLPGSFSEDIPIKGADGVVRQQTWYYPSREDCHTCHNDRAGLVLGLTTRQLNKPYTYPNGTTDNQLRAWNHAGLLRPALKDTDVATFERLAAMNNASRSLEDRARSYLDANCSHCHQPGGTVAGFDARFETPLDRQGLVDGAVLINEGLDKPRVLAPHDIWRSVAYMRMNTNGDIRMPPLARQTIDEHGVQLMRDWIDSMPGRDVLEPPAMFPAGGMFNSPVEVKLTHPEPGADIHYTLDGSVPGLNDPRYERPILLSASAVLRTRAFKEGFTRSITEQQVFIVGK